MRKLAVVGVLVVALSAGGEVLLKSELTLRDRLRKRIESCEVRVCGSSYMARSRI
jgi:hypothetical protein